MLVVYPLLVSSTLPVKLTLGICKTAERFITVYMLDDVLTKLGNYKSIKNESEQIDDIIDHYLIEQQGYPPGMTWQLKTTVSPAAPKTPPRPVVVAPTAAGTTTKIIDARDKSEDKSAKVDLAGLDVLALEPTWVTIQTKAQGTLVVGVKVIPYLITSTENFAKLLSEDSSRKLIWTWVKKLDRFVQRSLNRVKIKMLRWVKKYSITGDVLNDVLLAGTLFRDRVLIAVDSTDLSDDFFKNSANVNKLFTQYWGSTIVCNHAEEVAYFCMKNFHGICSALPYRVMYSILSKHQTEIFDSPEDARMASPFLKISGPGQRSLVKRAMTESILTDWKKRD